MGYGECGVGDVKLAPARATRLVSRRRRAPQAGQERFHALGPIYYRDANGALLVYDITDRDSFAKVWLGLSLPGLPSAVPASACVRRIDTRLR